VLLVEKVRLEPCNIINVFTVTFGQFSVSLMDTRISYTVVLLVNGSI